MCIPIRPLPFTHAIKRGDARKGQDSLQPPAAICRKINVGHAVQICIGINEGFAISGLLEEVMNFRFALELTKGLQYQAYLKKS